jgi:hypothetical protein
MLQNPKKWKPDDKSDRILQASKSSVLPMMMMILTIPAASASVERPFSALKKVHI